MVMQRPNWCHETSLPAEPASARRARAFVIHYLVDHRLMYLIDPIRLITSELTTNAIQHARTAFTVTLKGFDDVVVVTVEDRVSVKPDPSVPQQVLATSGRGLGIVEVLSDEWGVIDDRLGSKTVWASFATRSE
jgi:anti-sigma regulatory factor (Ser/Thr protein kinase)